MIPDPNDAKEPLLTDDTAQATGLGTKLCPLHIDVEGVSTVKVVASTEKKDGILGDLVDIIGQLQKDSDNGEDSEKEGWRDDVLVDSPAATSLFSKGKEGIEDSPILLEAMERLKRAKKRKLTGMFPVLYMNVSMCFEKY